MALNYTYSENKTTFHTRSFGGVTIETENPNVKNTVAIMLAGYDKGMSSHKTLVKTVVKALKNPDADVDAIVIGYIEIVKAIN